jgi:hypothetical protein
VSGLKDVQRFFMLLQPQQPSGGSCRLVVIGKKKLPSPAKHERYFAFVGEQRSQPARNKQLLQLHALRHRCLARLTAGGQCCHVLVKNVW